MDIKTVLFASIIVLLAISADAQSKAEYVATGYVNQDVSFRHILNLEFQEDGVIGGSFLEMAVSGEWQGDEGDELVQVRFRAGDGISAYHFDGWLQDKVGIWGRWTVSNIGTAGDTRMGAFEARYLDWSNWP